VSAVQLICCKHKKLCSQVLGAPPGQSLEAMSIVNQGLVKAALLSALEVSRGQVRSAAIGLEISPASPVIVHLLQCAPQSCGKTLLCSQPHFAFEDVIEGQNRQQIMPPFFI
jgi:hypothetical protein